MLTTDHRFTGQKLDGSSLMYYNARYYDPTIGQFVSPDTIVPDPENVLAYNRYMYALGNPLKYADPSGHCAMNADGTPDRQNDAECWGWADEYAGSWNADPNYFSEGWDISPDEWLENVATQRYADADFIKGGVAGFWSPKYREWGVHHTVYNPAPDLHAPPEHHGPLEYCRTNDCITHALDGVSTAAAVVGAGCSLAGAVPCVATASAIGITASGISTGRTLYLAKQGEATEADVAMSAVTFTVGSARKIHPAIAVASSVTQWLWDSRGTAPH